MKSGSLHKRCVLTDKFFDFKPEIAVQWHWKAKEKSILMGMLFNEVESGFEPLYKVLQTSA
jgi:hypothetical protein